MTNDHNKNIKELCQALLLLETDREAYNFLKDLCTPAELIALTERWQICKALNNGLSYREIHAQTGASLTTIGRVARFLKDEQYQGYSALLQKLKNKKTSA
ncbi:YerC/YecD family TrpR-related protein [Candidatus Lariskella endosymbiont of Epinotia ramella]|uniref:YerC/YecD family TrpR-related protein n=1 Tax=Candidatus Lariskella endosymbiont of Epinotia ramella TaxID=3066224 RepID=UPI0030CFC160